MLLSPFLNQISHQFLFCIRNPSDLFFYFNKLLFFYRIQACSHSVSIHTKLNEKRFICVCGHELLFSSTLISILFSCCERTRWMYFFGYNNLLKKINVCVSDCIQYTIGEKMYKLTQTLACRSSVMNCYFCILSSWTARTFDERLMENQLTR